MLRYAEPEVQLMFGLWMFNDVNIIQTFRLLENLFYKTDGPMVHQGRAPVLIMLYIYKWISNLHQNLYIILSLKPD